MSVRADQVNNEDRNGRIMLHPAVISPPGNDAGDFCEPSPSSPEHSTQTIRTPPPCQQRTSRRRRSSGVSFEVHASLVLSELSQMIDREDAAEEEEMRKKSKTNSAQGDDDDEDSLDGIPTAVQEVRLQESQRAQVQSPSWRDSEEISHAIDSVLQEDHSSLPILRKLEARIVHREVRSGNSAMFNRSRSWGGIVALASSHRHNSRGEVVATSLSEAVLGGDGGNSSSRILYLAERRNATFDASAEETDEQRRGSRRLSANNPFLDQLAGGDFMEVLKP